VRITSALVVAVAACGAVGCGTSQVLTDEPTARIWANGQMIGRGHGEIQQRGMWETTAILVRAEDGREQVTTVKRRITGVTVLGALLTYGTCLIFCWEYPDTIWATLPPRVASAGMPGAADPWLTPPPGWEPKKPAAAVPPAAPTTPIAPVTPAKPTPADARAAPSDAMPPPTVPAPKPMTPPASGQ
jgi:hypothetical protein